MTKDLFPQQKKILPDGTEALMEIQEKHERPRWPYMSVSKKGNSCPFSLIYRKWVVHPDDVSKHPAWKNKEVEGAQ